MPAGAAVKADGYGLGARETTEALIEAGCRDFFVSTWAEAEALGQPAGRGRAWSCCTASDPTMSKPRWTRRRGPCLNSVEQVDAVEADRARPRRAT